MDGSFRGVVLKNGTVTHMHLRAIINPRSDLNWLVCPVHFIENVVKDVPRMGHRGDTPSNNAEIGHLYPGADELALLERSRAAMAEQREPEQDRRERPLKTKPNKVAESDRVVEGSNIPKERQAVESFQEANFNFQGAQEGSPETGGISDSLVPVTMKSVVPLPNQSFMQTHSEPKEH